MSVVRKCTRCFVPLQKKETLYLSRQQIINHQNKVINVPVFVYKCPICNQLELVEVEE